MFMTLVSFTSFYSSVFVFRLMLIVVGNCGSQE